ncbi:hypothetical protein Memar_1660 [Methanoculleus marisnigri JR1]|uniref:Uncharacterized protein n=1 Tax=Methanoculleus marisnigri (strain ATCC 35101 / DSM 1498 / JR1) TaxID=368407 RepID=A3CW37_METMJ|nr:hypothetical protein Memar_1660 [Methanoculleus marisnigri JR1]
MPNLGGIVLGTRTPGLWPVALHNSQPSALELRSKYLRSKPGTVDRGGCAPSVLVLPPFGQSHIAPGGGADGECDVPEERSSTTVRWGGGSIPPSKPFGFLKLAALALPCPHPPLGDIHWKSVYGREPLGQG